MNKRKLKLPSFLSKPLTPKGLRTKILASPEDAKLLAEFMEIVDLNHQPITCSTYGGPWPQWNEDLEIHEYVCTHCHRGFAIPYDEDWSYFRCPYCKRSQLR